MYQPPISREEFQAYAEIPVYPDDTICLVQLEGKKLPSFPSYYTWWWLFRLVHIHLRYGWKPCSWIIDMYEKASQFPKDEDSCLTVAVLSRNKVPLDGLSMIRLNIIQTLPRTVRIFGQKLPPQEAAVFLQHATTFHLDKENSVLKGDDADLAERAADLYVQLDKTQRKRFLAYLSLGSDVESALTASKVRANVQKLVQVTTVLAGQSKKSPKVKRRSKYTKNYLAKVQRMIQAAQQMANICPVLARCPFLCTYALFLGTLPSGKVTATGTAMFLLSEAEIPDLEPFVQKHPPRNSGEELNLQELICLVFQEAQRIMSADPSYTFAGAVRVAAGNLQKRLFPKSDPLI